MAIYHRLQYITVVYYIIIISLSLLYTYCYRHYYIIYLHMNPFYLFFCHTLFFYLTISYMWVWVFSLNGAIRRSVGPPADSLYRPDTFTVYAFHHNIIFVVYNKTKQWTGVHGVRESFLDNKIHRKPVQMSLFLKHHKIISRPTIIYSFNVRKGFAFLFR